MTLYFEVAEPAVPTDRTIVLSSGLGGSGTYWQPQLQALAQQARVVTYDHRGTGRSAGDVPPDGGIAAMADDVLEIASTLGLDRFDFAGHALGGLIGLDLALRAPNALRSLVVVNAWSRVDPQTVRCFRTRLTLLETAGVEAYVEAQPLFLYPAVWMSENIERLEQDDRHGTEHFQGHANLTRRIAALRGFDVDAHLSDIATPTLVVAARDDLLVPYTSSNRLAQGLPNSRLALSDFGAHAVNITEPVWFNETLAAFLTSTKGTDPS